MLDMLHVILIKFPQSVVDNQGQTFFLHLVVALANESDLKVRSMVSTVLKELTARASPLVLNLILDYSISWYVGEKQHLWSAAAQVRCFMFFDICYCFMPVPFSCTASLLSLSEWITPCLWIILCHMISPHGKVLNF